MSELSRLCIHTETVRTLTIEEVAKKFNAHGIPCVSVWRQTLEGRDPVKVGDILKGNGLKIVSLVRGGFFPSTQAEKRERAIEENKKAIAEASALGAPLLVLVCGADPAQVLTESVNQIYEALAELVPYAERYRIKLGIEPLHPMYADTRSAINTIKQANDLVEGLKNDWLGVVIDVYHTWWDPSLKEEIFRCGRMNKIFAFHVSDWKVPTKDMLIDRGLMGEGCIPVREITGWVDEAGFKGPVEVEIFSEKYWSMDQDQYIGLIRGSFINHV